MNEVGWRSAVLISQRRATHNPNQQIFGVIFIFALYIYIFKLSFLEKYFNLISIIFRSAIFFKLMLYVFGYFSIQIKKILFKSSDYLKF